MEEDERAIRNGVFDILCFLSSEKVTADQFTKIADKIKETVSIFNGEETNTQ